MKFSSGDALSVVEIMREVARTEILPSWRNLSPGAIRFKTSIHDIVTDADEAAETAITAMLRARFPGAAVIGEEATAANPALLDRLAEAELAFIVDPIDGTKNFSAGLPLFGVIIGVAHRGEVIAGFILDPIGNDVAIGLRGEGAWIETADGRRNDLRVAQAAPLHDMVGCVAWNQLAEPVKTTLLTNLAKVRAAPSYRCGAHEYRMIAGGHYHFLLQGKIMPWDHAAGWLIHREAGGFAARFDGSPYNATTHSGGILCAPDEDSWRLLRDTLFDVPSEGPVRAAGIGRLASLRC
ncbi:MULTISPECIES: inositol monophosphatase [Bosea]|uniref:inositol monophosphatase family protein n=1 Tax=Bosea TaxID=85413 RepID=UPI00214F7742|nr:MULTISPECIES: inositol monophosphatase [Bosea]MCR4521661.1 inositol monophosphatase [Bosea sp. 47.2.35]MDR6829406.1 fructose-1,6-bisphosphatase/inositol monophosphatase family enzyme [Bosea robiniae]MDR6896079.1 fructose-1,6-bisphosphatase/inositol monophosphatase family enzyme [Bosea sp. BE109]MDR7139687.1 fructose-1,6-bisphosphatase/inositol monophosphatase family enzyme [Bosea sp. BE168]MDR7176174.1 fructose-1,6-bisphosphatase/inositol monophosphatase family enzyme [Bosea sp. BE271]